MTKKQFDLVSINRRYEGYEKNSHITTEELDFAIEFYTNLVAAIKLLKNSTYDLMERDLTNRLMGFESSRHHRSY